MSQAINASIKKAPMAMLGVRLFCRSWIVPAMPMATVSPPIMLRPILLMYLSVDLGFFKNIALTSAFGINFSAV